MAKTAMKIKQQRKSLQNLRTSTRLLKKVWYLQNLFP